MTTGNLEALIALKDFDALYAYATAHANHQGEVQLEDSDGDLVTLQATSEISIDYIRRSHRGDTDDKDDGVFAKRLIKQADGEVTVSDIY